MYQQHRADARVIDSVEGERAIPTRTPPPVASDGPARRPITVPVEPA
jgi:hypothetical protein